MNTARARSPTISIVRPGEIARSVTAPSPFSRRRRAKRPRRQAGSSGDVEVDGRELEAEASRDALGGDVVPAGAVERRCAKGADGARPSGGGCGGVAPASIVEIG